MPIAIHNGAIVVVMRNNTKVVSNYSPPLEKWEEGNLFTSQLLFSKEGVETPDFCEKTDGFWNTLNS